MNWGPLSVTNSCGAPYLQNDRVTTRAGKAGKAGKVG